jgi:polysaccharide lyase-like protein
MAMPSTKVILFNAAASVVVIGALVGVVRTWIAPSSLRACSERYSTSMVFPLERDGVVLTATDIQARTGGQDAGLLENVDVVSLKRGPVPVAMSVRLPKGSAAPSSSVVPKGGISFPWQPRSLKDKSAVCLSYQMILPSDFDFNLGGVLPGVFGQSDHSDQSNDRFLVRLAWHQVGATSATNFVTLDGKKYKQIADAEGFTIPRGRWVKIDQEVILNEPDQENGILRVWLDGALAIDKADIAYRVKPTLTLTGVAADIFYNGEDVAGRAPADATVMLSPFEIRWQ